MKNLLALSRRNIFLALAILVIAAFGYGYFSGWSITSSGIASPGSISFIVPQKDTTVYFDGGEFTVTKTDAQIVIISGVRPGYSHSVLLGKVNYWPWKKDVTVASKQRIELSPFLISKSISGVQITAADPEYERINSMVASGRIPTVSNPKISKDGFIGIWAEGNTIKAVWRGGEADIPYYFCTPLCNNELTVITLPTTLRNLDFYKDTHDILLVGTGDSIAALDLDPIGTQNFQPIFKGGSPRFIVQTPTTLFVSDSSSLFEITI